MEKSKKVLIAGGAVVAAILLFAGISSASAKKPVGPPVDPKKKKDPVPQGNVPLVDSPFGKFSPCSNGVSVEPYASQLKAAMSASNDWNALLDAASVYGSHGCSDLANFASQRASTVQGGGQAPHVFLPSYGDTGSSCDASGQFVDGQKTEDVSKWIDNLTDASLATAAAAALRSATPPCEVLAKKADDKAAALSYVKDAGSSIGSGFSNAWENVTGIF